MGDFLFILDTTQSINVINSIIEFKNEHEDIINIINRRKSVRVATINDFYRVFQNTASWAISGYSQHDSFLHGLSSYNNDAGKKESAYRTAINNLFFLEKIPKVVFITVNKCPHKDELATDEEEDYIEQNGMISDWNTICETIKIFGINFYIFVNENLTEDELNIWKKLGNVFLARNIKGSYTSVFNYIYGISNRCIPSINGDIFKIDLPDDYEIDDEVLIEISRKTDLKKLSENIHFIKLWNNIKKEKLQVFYKQENELYISRLNKTVENLIKENSVAPHSWFVLKEEVDDVTFENLQVEICDNENGIPTNLPVEILFKILPHLISKGFCFSQKESILFAFYCYENNEILKPFSVEYLKKIKGTWYKEAEFEKEIFNPIEDFFTEEELNCIKTNKLKKIIENNVYISEDFKVYENKFTPYTRNCKKCNNDICFTIFPKGEICAYCLADVKNDSVNKSVQCVECDSFYTTKTKKVDKFICFYDIFQKEKTTVQCVDCKKRFINPDGTSLSCALDELKDDKFDRTKKIHGENCEQFVCYDCVVNPRLKNIVVQFSDFYEDLKSEGCIDGYNLEIKDSIKQKYNKYYNFEESIVSLWNKVISSEITENCGVCCRVYLRKNLNKYCKNCFNRICVECSQKWYRIHDYCMFCKTKNI